MPFKRHKRRGIIRMGAVRNYEPSYKAVFQTGKKIPGGLLQG